MKKNNSSMEKMLMDQGWLKSRIALLLYLRNSMFTTPVTFAKALEHIFEAPSRLEPRTSQLQLRPFNSHHFFSNYSLGA
jgi:hypothetical protein